eukprot:CAMPEP_0181359206 /NCGR_PEP_ID=MMETSP1106-20121128/5951_1 /TAXON_ID=81844 /ORGANISM="Mantoniella antarctica, Strain SL-175" /LENGTH=99 /DNA_ID=CAMNT_0023472281 /DNA_START=49 /DNA_END=348 /DNA_ORIENTATION=+
MSAILISLPIHRVNSAIKPKRAEARRSTVCLAAAGSKVTVSIQAKDFQCAGGVVVCGAADEAGLHSAGACAESVSAKTKCVHPERSSGFCKDCPRSRKR